MRAAARANTEQASKIRCGCRPAILTGKTAAHGEASAKSTRGVHRGRGGSTHGREAVRNRGNLSR